MPAYSQSRHPRGDEGGGEVIPTPVITAYVAAWRVAADGHVAELRAWEKRGKTGPKPRWDEHAYIAAGIDAAVDEMVKMGLIDRRTAG